MTMVTTVQIDVREALAKVIDYLSDEEINYEELREAEGAYEVRDHIWVSVRLLRDWLAKIP
jgi:hypothetical protein